MGTDIKCIKGIFFLMVGKVFDNNRDPVEIQESKKCCSKFLLWDRGSGAVGAEEKKSLVRSTESSCF